MEKTSWLDPQLTGSKRKPLEECAEDDGWEEGEDAEYGVYYVDHYEKKTQFDNPVLLAKGKLQNQMNQSQNKLENADFQQNKGPARADFTKDPAQLSGELSDVSVEKSPNGFGFTIVGGDEPEEYLQIKSVVQGGPADRTGNIRRGDVIVKVNDTCVLGWTHPQVVQLFRSFPINHMVNLQICRGYLLPFDPDDLNTSLVTMVAIPPEDHVSGINSQPSAYDCSKFMPDIVDHSFYQHDSHNGVSQHNPMRVGSFNLQLLQVILKKGDKGFGFTVVDSPQGQRIEQILDKARCHDLCEGDIIVEINGNAVVNMPHNNLIDTLKDCPAHAEVIFIIERPTQAQPSANEISPTHQPRAYQQAYPQHTSPYMRQHLDMRSNGGNDSLVSAPPTSTNTFYPMGSVFNEYRNKHQMMSPNYIENGYGHPFEQRPARSQAALMHPGPVNSSVDNPLFLRRMESGSGFRILGGEYDDDKVAIVSGGTAELEGTLRKGDELLLVDGIGISYYNVVIERQRHEGFGFVIISSAKKTGNYIPHKIGRIIEGSPAARCQKLHVNDHILAINGEDIHDLRYGQIAALIEESRMAISLRVACLPSPASSER